MNATERPHAPAPVPLRCPRCGATVAPEQDWCLECGAPARTRLAPTPNWRLPIAAVALVVVLAGVALAVAFAALTRDEGTVVAPATATTAAPAQPTETPTASVPAPPPVTATTAAPGTGTPAMPTTATPTPPAAGTPTQPATPTTPGTPTTPAQPAQP